MKYYISPEATEDPITKTLLSRVASDDVIFGLPEFEVNNFDEGKECLVLKHHKGSWLRACPGTSEHVCCNLWTVNPGEGCPLDCTYCYLQSYLKNNPALKLYTNTYDMLGEIDRRLDADPNRFFRVGTGEVIDSLVWDELTDCSVELVDFFAEKSNALLELKTKTNKVKNLLQIEHGGNTVVSWSVNAPTICRKEEHKTASLDERIEAACEVVEAGYKVGFHFDPLIYFEGWEDEYSETVEKIFSRVPVSSVAWVSVSSLRYKKDMQLTMESRFPDSIILYGEQILAVDGKMRYLQPLRFKMIRHVQDKLKSISEEMPVYFCMESSAAWRNIAQTTPGKDANLADLFTKKGRGRLQHFL